MGTIEDDFLKSQAERRAALEALRNSDWEEDSNVTHVHAEPGAVVHVGNTGKHQAVKKSEPPSTFPAKVAKPVASILGAVKSWPQVFALAIIVGGFVAWLLLRK